VTTSGTVQASFTTSSLSGAAGGTAHNIIAVYSGDTTYASSTSSSSPITVSPVGTTPDSFSSLAVKVGTLVSTSSVYGTAVNLVATLANVASPAGTVAFYDGSAATGTFLGNGTQLGTTFTLSNVVLSNTNGTAHTITAVYSGDGTYASTSKNTSYTVTQANSKTVVTNPTSASSVSLGTQVTITATVSGVGAGAGAGAPTQGGGVTFQDTVNSVTTNIVPNGTTITVTYAPGAGNTLVATLKTTQLSKGTHTITAVYNGDQNYLASTVSPGTSGTTTQMVIGATAAVSPWSESASTVTTSGMVTFTLTLIGVGGVAPMGTVNVYADSTSHLIGTASVLSSSGGSTTWTLTVFGGTIGGSKTSHNIGFIYSGDSNYTGINFGAGYSLLPLSIS
jgi:hypothetical protein